MTTKKEHSNSLNKEISFFKNGCVSNRVISFKNSTQEKCIFIPNWRAKLHHWEEFCNVLSKDYSLDYFETREKPSTLSANATLDYSNEKSAFDIICFINANMGVDYHLILCSFSAPLVFSRWDKIIQKPKSLVLICPIQKVRLPWPVRLFSTLPKNAFPFLYNTAFNLANRIKALKAICKNHRDLFRDGNMDELIKFQASVKAVLKLSIPYCKFEKSVVPTLVVMPLNDKVHCPVACRKIQHSIKDSIMVEVENFKIAHGVEMAKKISEFVKEHSVMGKNIEMTLF